MLWLLLAGALAVGGTIGAIYVYVVPSLPDTADLRDVRFQVPLRVYSRKHKLIAEFGEMRRIPLRYGEIPKRMVQAFVAAEDDRFFEHPGVDIQGLIRAGLQLMLTGERRQGGSTITMQVARNFFLSRTKTFSRKLHEILLALQIDRDLSKEEILELYLNKIYLGNRAYGVGAAAQVYYGGSVAELDLAQTAMIAALPKAPSRVNPVASPERAIERRNYVLGRMAELGFVSKEEASRAMRAPVTARLHTAGAEVDAPYVAEMARSEMVERYGPDAYTNAYEVLTTLDARFQEEATAALRGALDDYDRRHGYRGPEGHVDIGAADAPGHWAELLSERQPVGSLLPALVVGVEDKSVKVALKDGGTETIDWDGLKWAAPLIDENRRGAAPKTAGDVLKRGDLIRIQAIEGSGDKEPRRWRLAEVPAVEGAMVVVDPTDGAIRALIGGYDFARSKFNRVTQAHRQPGSGFKPFIYSAALEAGFTPASLINDAPVVFADAGTEEAWRPENYSRQFFGPTRLRVALAKSRNLVSIRLLRAIGIDRAISHAALFGFDPDELPRNLSLALGTASVTPLQMARGFAVLANGGFRVEPYLINRIDLEGQGTVFQADPARVCKTCETPVASSPAEGASASTPAANPNLTAAQPATQAQSQAQSQSQQPGHVAPRVISPENYYVMNSMLRGVIREGTGVRARSLGRNDIAGKTGTTNDQRDAWFNGFHPTLVAIVWVGFDNFAPLGRAETGGHAALPAWIAFMGQALKGVPEELPVMPPDMVTVAIDPATGRRAAPGATDAIFEVFRADQVPAAGPAGAAASKGEAGVVESLF